MSSMSSRFMSHGGSVPTDGLVPLYVHPADRDRLRSLSGIWPVEDTLSRMIDVFIASGAAQSAPSVQSAAARVEPDSLTKVSASESDFAKNDSLATPEPAASPTPKAHTSIARLADPRKTTQRAKAPRADKPAPVPAPVEQVNPSPATTPLLAFTREDYPDLKFTTLTGFSLGTVSRQGSGLNWSSFFEEAVAQAIAAGYNAEDLEKIGVRLREGRHSEKGFRWCGRLNRSVQVSTSNYMFTRILRISDLIGIPIRIGVSWDVAEGAAHPGQSALISAKPIRRDPKMRSESEPAQTKDESEAVEGRFPTIGSMVSYVYLDRPDDEKLSLLVDGIADAEAGQVSVTSPLGKALLDTPTGGVVTLDLKGSLRKVRVMEVALP